MARACTGALGAFSPLDEDPLLFAEWEVYAAAHARQAARDAARQKRDAARRGAGGRGHSRRVAGHRR